MANVKAGDYVTAGFFLIDPLTKSLLQAQYKQVSSVQADGKVTLQVRVVMKGGQGAPDYTAYKLFLRLPAALSIDAVPIAVPSITTNVVKITPELILAGRATVSAPTVWSDGDGLLATWLSANAKGDANSQRTLDWLIDLNVASNASTDFAQADYALSMHLWVLVRESGVDKIPPFEASKSVPVMVETDLATVTDLGGHSAPTVQQGATDIELQGQLKNQTAVSEVLIQWRSGATDSWSSPITATVVNKQDVKWTISRNFDVGGPVSLEIQCAEKTKTTGKEQWGKIFKVEVTVMTVLDQQALATSVDTNNSKLETVPNPPSVEADGTTEIALKATLLDSTGFAVEGLQVKWDASIGMLGGSPGSGVTDEYGQVTASLISEAAGPGTVSLKAAVTGAELVSTAVKFTETEAQKQLRLQGAVVTVKSTLDATPTHAPADGKTPITLSSTFHDINDAPVEGLEVMWQTTGGVFTAGSSGVSDSLGQATATLTSNTVGNTTVTVSAGSSVSLQKTVEFDLLLPDFGLDDLSKITCYKAVKVSGKFKQALREDVIISVGKDDTNWQNLSPLIDKSKLDFSMMAPEALFKDASGTPDLYMRARYSSYLDAAASWVKHQGKVTIDNTVPVLAGLRTYVEGVNVVLTGKVTAPVATNDPVTDNPVTVQVEWDNSKNLRDAIVTRNSDGTSQFTQMVALTDIKNLLVPAVVHAKTLAGMDIQQEQKISFSQLTPELVSVVVAIDKGTPTTLKTGADQLELKAPTGQFELHITVTAHVGLPELELSLSLVAAAWQIGTARIDSGSGDINTRWSQSHSGKFATIKQGQSVVLVLPLILRPAKEDKITIELADIQKVIFSAPSTYQKIHFSH